MSREFPLAVLLAGALAAAGCGGGDATLLSAPQPAPFVAPLFDDDGNPAPSVAGAGDPANVSRTQRYATVEQAQRFSDDFGERALRLHFAHDDTAEVQRVIDTTHNAPAGQAPIAVLVSADDLRLAAAVVDRLQLARVPNVWLVTP